MFAAIGLVVVGLLALRERTLNKLHASNEVLRQELAAATNPDTPPGSPSPAGTNLASPLTPEEQTELLRLRGQVGLLRHELQDVSNKPRH